MYKIKDIRTDLYLDGEDFTEYWNEWKYDIIRAVRKQEKTNKNFIICLESDLQREIEYYAEDNKVLEIIAIDSGVVFYKVKKNGGRK